MIILFNWHPKWGRTLWPPTGPLYSVWHFGWLELRFRIITHKKAIEMNQHRQQRRLR